VRVFVNAVVLLAFVLQPIMWIQIMVTAGRDQKAIKAIARTISDKKVLSTDSYFAALSSEPEMLDPYLMTQLEKRGYWSSDPILSKVSAQQYDFVIFRTNPEERSGGTMASSTLQWGNCSNSAELRSLLRELEPSGPTAHQTTVISRAG
jgi:hypothetical protein